MKYLTALNRPPTKKIPTVASLRKENEELKKEIAVLRKREESFKKKKEFISNSWMKSRKIEEVLRVKIIHLEEENSYLKKVNSALRDGLTPPKRFEIFRK